jgi:hypothetical protein
MRFVDFASLPPPTITTVLAFAIARPPLARHLHAHISARSPAEDIRYALGLRYMCFRLSDG